MANLVGEAVADLLEGTLDADVIEALAGNDTLYGLDGNDSLVGNDDNDLIFGDNGEDTLDGGTGEDTLVGGLGNTGAVSEAERDVVLGGLGNDVIFGNEGIDVIEGGAGNDIIYGGRDNDELIGNDGNDLIYGDFGADRMTGGAGADVFLTRFVTIDTGVDQNQVDRIRDFEDDRDIVDIVANEDGRWRFEDFTISPGEGEEEGNAIVSDSLTGQTLLIFENMSVNEINAGDFRFFGAGDVQVTLRWNSTNDLDLHVTDPAGEEIYFANPTSASGGELDVDANAACVDTVLNPAENIFWPSGEAPNGSYLAEVELFSRCDSTSGPIPFSLTVTTSSGFQSIDGLVDESNPVVSLPFEVTSIV
ncbi:MAG: hypothetical protein J7641_04895 [Cyanobacteria bacterium SID2]|nr:hypothetical protein [Cyanobacteria bacterium SID2]